MKTTQTNDEGFKFNYSAKEKALNKIQQENAEKESVANSKNVLNSLGIEVY